jgi:hypothetical protein
MVNGLETKGYYTFENGNTISNYIWTKSVNAKSTYGFRLTTQCTDNNDPVLFPGWRGQNDDWATVASQNVTTGFTEIANTNLAIKGLFNYIDPNGAEAAALVANGYKRVDWGKTIVDNKAEYLANVFLNYTEGTPPICCKRPL